MGSSRPRIGPGQLRSVAHGDGTGAAARSEELPGELLHQRWVVALAAEDVQVRPVRVVGEVPADKRRLDELEHRVACHPSLTEMDDLALPESLHLDQFTERDDVGLDVVTVPDGFRPTVVKINCSGEAPSFPLPDQLLR